MKLSMDQSYLNIIVISTPWTLNYGDYVPFFILILSMLFTIEPTNFKKSYSGISKKHDQTSINLTNIFNFIC